MSTQTQYITLSELQQAVHETLSKGFPYPVWVSAEISELKVNLSGHCYLDLVEKEEDDTKSKARAQARGVIWSSQYGRIATTFEAETGRPLSAGIRILAKVIVGYHAVYGLSLQVQEIDSTYTLGDMERQRQLTIHRLQAEGVWEMNHQQPLPKLIQHIAIVSSSRAAGYQDFCKELQKSIYRFETTLFEVAVQGDTAETSIVTALERIASAEESFDVVTIIRGGGSANDLNCFNSYRLSNHVAQFPLPILTGIGHDKDTSIVDMVARKAFKTPTAVAAWLVERMALLDQWLSDATTRLHDQLAVITHKETLRIEQRSAAIGTSVATLIARQQTRLQNAEEQLLAAPAKLLRTQQQRIDTATELLLSYSIEHVLQRGFAIARCGNQVVHSIDEVQQGETLEIELNDGRIDAQITKVTKR